MSNNATLFVPILDSSNYGLWSTVMKAFLMSLGLWAHVTGVTAAPAEVLSAAGEVINQEVRDKWFERDTMAIGHITLWVSLLPALRTPGGYRSPRLM